MHRTPRFRAALAAGLWLAGAAAAATELNTANQAELEQVKGVGPQLSEQLLHERARRGPYAGWPDLMGRIKGVGPARAAKLSAAGLRVSGQAYGQPAPVASAPVGMVPTSPASAATAPAPPGAPASSR